MKSIKTFEQFILEESSGNILKPKRNEWVKINPRKYPELADEFYDLIKTAYSSIGGHAKISTPSDVFKDPDWTYWMGVDIHKSPDVDVIIWGQNTKYGIKFSGVGHDGSKIAKKKYLNDRVTDLNKKGFFGEISGKLAEILIGRYNVPVVSNEADVERVLGKDITWHGKHPTDLNMPGNGWYTRMLGGKPHEKILVGKPKI